MKILIYFLTLFTFIKLNGQIPSNVPASGLMGYWPFTGNANDISGNNYNGTVFGAQLSADRFNNAASSYSFNGISNYILTNYQGILGSNARAVSFWAKTNESLSVITGIAWGSNSTANRFGCGFNYNGNGPTIGIANGAMTYSSSTSISNNQWHHYVFQYNGGSLNQVQIFMDGSLLTQTVSSLNPASVLNTLAGFNVQFGRVDFSSSQDYFKGQLDDIGMWNRILTNSEIIALYQPTSLTAFVSQNNVLCNGNCNGSATVTPAGGTAPYTYSWSAGSQSAIVNGLCAGTYTVIVTDATSATSAVAINILQPSPVIINSTPNSSICPGACKTLTAGATGGTSPYTYTLQPGNFTGTAVTVCPSSNTTYSLLVTDNNGCMSATSVNLSLTNVTPNAGSNQTITCSNSVVTLNGSGLNTYNWSGPSIVSGGSTSSPMVSAPGIYSLTGTTNFCVANTATVMVLNNTTPPVITISGTSGSICMGSSVTLTASGSATSYSWSIGAITSTISVSPTTSANYVVTGINSTNGCQSSTSQFITVLQNPTVTISTSNSIICAGQSATLLVTGANTYSWSNNSNATAIVVTPTANTTYSVTGTNANNCSNAAAFTQSITSCVSVKEKNYYLNIEFTIYPNPASEFVTFSSNENLVIEIFNLLGSKIAQTYSPQGIDCSSYTKGVYLVKATNSVGESVSKLIIID